MRQAGLAAEDLVFLDETGFNLGMTKRDAWAPKGQRAVDFRPGNKGKNVSVLAAISVAGLLSMATMVGGLTIPDFLSFLAKRLIPRLRKGMAIVMDNLSVHKNKQVVSLLRAHGIGVIFTPPYSPEFNPIENVWSILKSRFRKRLVREARKMRRGIAATWRTLGNLDFERLVSSCGYA